jgi:tRNA uridine 5-carbamoylmethylation protein Kti12
MPKGKLLILTGLPASGKTTGSHGMSTAQTMMGTAAEPMGEVWLSPR